MLDDLRKPFFFLAIALIIIAVLVELSSMQLVGLTSGAAAALDAPTPGHGIPYLAILDGLVVYSVVLMGISLLIPERVHGRIQGIATLVVSLLCLLASVTMIFAAIQVLTLMATLLLSPLFGTIAYFMVYADFDRDSAAITLSLLMLLKLGFAFCLVFAHQRFLENKGLVLIVLTSLVAGLIISFLHAVVPGFLVSITDMIGALIAAILALLWAVVFLIGSLVSIVRAVA